MAPRGRARPSRALEGEDLETSHWEDARHWMNIYADLPEFKRGILDRVVKDMASLRPLAQKAAALDLQIIEDQMPATRSASTCGTAESGSSADCGSTPKAG